MPDIKEKTIETTKGLEFVDKKVKDTAEDFYEDERVEDVLNLNHTPNPKDFDLINDMINKLKNI